MSTARNLKPGIGHNSVQIIRHGSVKDEATWRAAERSMLRRERFRLVRSGTIRPASMMQPQLMVKNQDGSWSPEIMVIAP